MRSKTLLQRLFPMFLAVLLVAVLFLVGCGEPQRRTPQPAKVPVRSELLAAGPFQPVLRLWGKVEPAQRVPLSTPAEGEIRYASRFAAGLRTGEKVRAGEVLFEIESESLRLRLAEAELMLRREEAELDRTRRGVEGGFMSAADLQRVEINAELATRRLETARTDVEQLRQTAPRAGVLRVEKVVAPGTRVRGGEVVAEIAGAGASAGRSLGDGVGFTEA